MTKLAEIVVRTDSKGNRACLVYGNTPDLDKLPDGSYDVSARDHKLRDAVGGVLEGFTLPPAVRKILETAHFS
jgi:hypothetical protein